jgi:microcystin degradation protein MlrC
MDVNGHGTHVAGIASANGSIKGVAPGSKIVMIKASNSSGAFFEDDLLSAIQWCKNNLTFNNMIFMEGFDDVEGEILSAIRQVVNRSIPIALMLDHHANVTHKMMDQVDVLMAFRTQPHDPYETARDLTKIALETFSKKISPTMAWRKIPMITHQEQFLTASGPMKEWFDIARRFEDEGKALSISLFPMQPWLDVNEAGWSVVVVTDNNQIAAQEIAVELANHAWSKREHFMVLELIQNKPNEMSSLIAPALKDNRMLTKWISENSDNFPDDFKEGVGVYSDLKDLGF